VEACTNVIVGILLTWCAAWLLLAALGYQPTAAKSFFMGVMFTALTLASSCVLRRIFSLLEDRGRHARTGCTFQWHPALTARKKEAENRAGDLVDDRAS
tara:strand:- start:746 stop:1042 length:297 start_codon:yes stop_codon:yes gene_type:complete